MVIFTPTYRDLATFFMHAEQMEKAGVPLRQMLDVAAKDSSHRAISRACFWMLHDVQSGKTLSEAMTQHPRVFNATVVALVAAGEKTGRMGQMLSKCFEHCMQMELFQKNMRRATRNFKFSGIVVLGLMLTLGKTAAPLATVVLLVLAAGVIAAYCFVPAFRKFCDYLFIVTPALGEFIRHLEMARFTEMLALYYDAGIPVRDALAAAVDMVQNDSMRKALARAGQRVVAGEHFAEAFRSMPRVDHIFLGMLATGERSGNLAHTMREAGLYYRNEMENSLDKLQKAAAPLLTILLGWVIYAAFA
ncbi:MAG TPA: type II secretion system F family protein [Alphaproteobacteria bacterium]|nr:type II secretion system F family protein [Alphaproteobacteria bacterium]